MSTPDTIVLTLGWRSVPATVTLASPDRGSLIVEFEAILDGCAGSMALLRDEHGVYRNLITGNAITVTENADDRPHP